MIDFQTEELFGAGSKGARETGCYECAAVALVDAGDFLREWGGVDPGHEIGGGFDGDGGLVRADADRVGHGEAAFHDAVDQVILPAGGGVDGRGAEIVAESVVDEVGDAVVVVVTHGIGGGEDGVGRSGVAANE